VLGGAVGLGQLGINDEITIAGQEPIAAASTRR
jgi:hypothetical protein